MAVGTAEKWSVAQTAAVAAAEAIAAAAAADVAAEAAATAQAAVTAAVAAALRAACRAQEVAAAALVAGQVSREALQAAGGGQLPSELPSAGVAGSETAATVARRVESVAAAAAIAVVEAASVIQRQLAVDVAAAAQAVATTALVVDGPDSAQPTSPPAAFSPSTPGRTARPIFVLDADPACRLRIAESLSALGLGNPCIEFSDGRSVVRALQQSLDLGAAHVPALVLLDADLTGTSGADVLEWMARTEGLAGTPVILLSSDARAVDVNRAYRLGARSYLVKPVGLAALGSVARDLGLAWMLV